jgi:hypothetical protein
VVYLRALHVWGIVVAKLLWVLHRHRWVHIRGARQRIRQGWAASSLVWRVRELGVHWPALTLEWGSHATTSLVGLVSKRRRRRRIPHLLLILRVETAATSPALGRETATTWPTWSLCMALNPHVALTGL